MTEPRPEVDLGLEKPDSTAGTMNGAGVVPKHEESSAKNVGKEDKTEEMIEAVNKTLSAPEVSQTKEEQNKLVKPAAENGKPEEVSTKNDKVSTEEVETKVITGINSIQSNDKLASNEIPVTTNENAQKVDDNNKEVGKAKVVNAVLATAAIDDKIEKPEEENQSAEVMVGEVKPSESSGACRKYLHNSQKRDMVYNSMGTNFSFVGTKTF